MPDETGTGAPDGAVVGALDGVAVALLVLTVPVSDELETVGEFDKTELLPAPFPFEEPLPFEPTTGAPVVGLEDVDIGNRFKLIVDGLLVELLYGVTAACHA